jgi:hypothetical protein
MSVLIEGLHFIDRQFDTTLQSQFPVARNKGGIPSSAATTANAKADAARSSFISNASEKNTISMPLYAADECERGKIIVYGQDVMVCFMPHWV